MDEWVLIDKGKTEDSEIVMIEMQRTGHEDLRLSPARKSLRSNKTVAVAMVVGEAETSHHGSRITQRHRQLEETARATVTGSQIAVGDGEKRIVMISHQTEGTIVMIVEIVDGVHVMVEMAETTEIRDKSATPSGWMSLRETRSSHTLKRISRNGRK